MGQYSTCAKKDCFFWRGGGGQYSTFARKLTKTLYSPYKSNLFGGRHCDSRIHRKFYFMASIKKTRLCFNSIPKPSHAAIATSTAFASTNVGRGE